MIMSAQSTPIHIHPLEALKANPFVLAPMAGITDRAFRTFMKKLDASVVVTELISAAGIEYKSERTMSLMSYDENSAADRHSAFWRKPGTHCKSGRGG